MTSPQRSFSDLAPVLGVLVLGVVLGTGITAAYFTANPVTKTETVIRYQTVEEPVSENGTVFTVTHGPNAPPDWGYPVRVEFQQVEGTNFTTKHMVTVEQNERFVLDLNESARYRVKLTPPEGDPVFLGSVTPRWMDNSVDLLVGACCTDTTA